MKRQLKGTLLIVIGFILSPLSWWNDLLVNVPLAYLFSLPFSLMSESLYLPSFILGYWLTNLLGLLMLHWGYVGLVHRERKTISINHNLAISVIYSIIIIMLVQLGWLDAPSEYLHRLK